MQHGPCLSRVLAENDGESASTNGYSLFCTPPCAIADPQGQCAGSRDINRLRLALPVEFGRNHGERGARGDGDELIEDGESPGYETAIAGQPESR